MKLAGISSTWWVTSTTGSAGERAQEQPVAPDRAAELEDHDTMLDGLDAATPFDETGAQVQSAGPSIRSSTTAT